ncbi:ferredoxin [Alteromonas alba]|uniref:Ferredoxin n=1 Tax=Alteromonas alba TaxID=2079529 RepID=A0A2S9V6I3_9ALTE|nr:2Fe-2S iron-sulfur cluster-binding protein [Alteromonas alba]PRO72033.1 ferredoxin [Alteromonas alba]
MTYTIDILNTQESYSCRANESLLDGMARLGRKGIPVGCRGGGCGICKIRIESGEYTAKKMSRCHVSEEEQAAGVVLACKVFPLSDITLRVIGKCQRQFERKCVKAETFLLATSESGE